MILQVKNLSFKYSNSRTIFNNVNFSLDKGEVLSILGTNGAGKSTLLNCIANIYKPTSGDILLNGNSSKSMTMRDISKVIGYVPQVHTPTYAYTVREFTVMGRTPYIGAFSKPSKEDYQIADESLKKMGIFHLKDKAYTEISGGERQQVTIARALTQQPQIILLDEPTAHLDYGNQYRVVKMIKELANNGFSVIMTTHNPEHAIILNGKVAILDRNGVLNIGNSSEKLTGNTLSKLYDLNIKTVYDNDAKRNICIIC